MNHLPDKIWEFDEIVAKSGLPKLSPARRMGWNTLYSFYHRFVERELLKHGEVAVRNSWCGNISYWHIPFPGVYNPETGQVW